MIVQQQGNRAEGKWGVTEAKFRGYSGHDAGGGGSERGAMEPPTIIIMVYHHWRVRVRGAETSNMLCRRKEGRLI